MFKESTNLLQLDKTNNSYGKLKICLFYLKILLSYYSINYLFDSVVSIKQ